MACAAKQPSPAHAGYDRDRAERLFTVSYEDIADIYIDDVEIGRLALSGLRRLETLDPALRVRPAGGTLAVTRDSHRNDFRLPDGDEVADWAALTARVIDAGRRTSKALADASAEDLYGAVFTGIVSRLDRYSRYAGADKARENRANRDGFGGIGVRIRVREKGIEVVSVMDGSPAAKAGLTRGDLIVAVNGRPTRELGSKDGVRALRGPIDTQVRLTVRRPRRSDPVQMAVKRARIVPRTVSYETRNGVVYLRVTGFNQRTTASLRDAIRQAQAKAGGDLGGYVLDLRDNPGGLLDQAVSVADLFLSGGRVVATHGRHPDSHQYFDAEPGHIAEGRPVAVLINADSASASEIVAAALQDSGRAVVLGSTSYGKGTVQTVLRLPNEGELTLTWARFLAPSGYALSRHGVVPNVCTSLTKARALPDLVYQVARGDLAPRLPAPAERTQASPETPPSTPRTQAAGACPSDGHRAARDVDLARRLLRDRDLFQAALAGRPARVAKAHPAGGAD
jgi:carboxyl-terminal processing protease